MLPQLVLEVGWAKKIKLPPNRKPHPLHLLPVKAAIKQMNQVLRNLPSQWNTDAPSLVVLFSTILLHYYDIVQVYRHLTCRYCIPTLIIILILPSFLSHHFLYCYYYYNTYWDIIVILLNTLCSHVKILLFFFLSLLWSLMLFNLWIELL